jgi:hypothetical protein
VIPDPPERAAIVSSLQNGQALLKRKCIEGTSAVTGNCPNRLRYLIFHRHEPDNLCDRRKGVTF